LLSWVSTSAEIGKGCSVQVWGCLPLRATLPLLGVVAAECVVATVVLLPLAVMRLPNRLPDLEVIVSLLVLGLICTALAYLTFYALVSEVGASRGTVFTYVNPVVSVFLGVTLLGESLNAAIVTGFILILVGSWLSTGGGLPPGYLMRRRLQKQARRDAGEARQDTSHQQLR
jgi:drug/metabolite transporter (DMT)-like permease